MSWLHYNSFILSSILIHQYVSQLPALKTDYHDDDVSTVTETSYREQSLFTFGRSSWSIRLRTTKYTKCTMMTKESAGTCVHCGPPADAPWVIMNLSHPKITYTGMWCLLKITEIWPYPWWTQQRNVPIVQFSLYSCQLTQNMSSFVSMRISLW